MCENKKTETELTIGIMRINKGLLNPNKPQSVTFSRFLLAKHFGIKLVFFTPGDVNFETGLVKGLTVECGKVTEITVPIPNIIDNSLLGADMAEFLAKIEERSYLIRHRLFYKGKRAHKWTMHNVLKEGPFKNILIPTTDVGINTDRIINFAEKYSKIIVKPITGFRGGGLFRVTRLGEDCYKVENDCVIRELSGNSMIDVLAEKKAFGNYMMSEYVNSVTAQGEPFDIRVHCRRGAGGRFVIDLFPRIGNPKGFVSNISTGGYTQPIDFFLKTQFPRLHVKIKKALVELGDTFPDYWQSLFEMNIFDIGLDIGVTADGDEFKLHLFEVNTYIDGYSFEVKDAMTHFGYYRYLDSKLQADANANA
jgi:hypothetical protein